MNRTKIENNKAILNGEIVGNFEFSHDIYGEGFYVARLAIERFSEVKDVISIMVSERLVDVKSDWAGRFIKVSGQFRSYNKHEGERTHLILSVFVREFEEIGFEHEELGGGNDDNRIFLNGYICKPPTYRKTPLGREIADILLAVNRPYGKSDYIPCVAWGRNARFTSGLEVGARLQVFGRIQSRIYHKKTENGEPEPTERTAYEVSINKLAVVEETEE